MENDAYTAAPDADVHVIGAGFAGSLLAAKLATRASVSIIEKRRLGRCRNCAGGLPEKTFQDLGIDVPVVKINRVILSVNGTCHEFPCRYVVADRVQLDQALREKALTTGATLERGELVTVDVERHRFRYRSDDRVFETAFKKLVLVHGFKPHGGAVSGLNDLPSKHHAIARLQVIAGTSPYPNAMFIHVGRKIRHGYSWIFPMPNDRMNVGTGALAHAYEANILEKFKRENQVEGVVLDAGGGRLPAAPARRVELGDVVLFGDAAGMVYPLNGEGLTYAAELADHWADGILDGSDLNAIWRWSRAYWKLRFGETTLSTLAWLETWFNLPLYPMASAVSAWRRRFNP